MIPSATKSPADAVSRDAPLRVMIVDDSVVIRSMIARWIGEEDGLHVVATLRNGREAVDQLERVNPDVAVLDIEMPELDGISALPLLLAKRRDLTVIMASTLTRRNAEISLKALSLGAADYVPKPESTRETGTVEEFRRDLIQKIRNLGKARRRMAPIARPGDALAALKGDLRFQPRPVARPDQHAFTLRPLGLAQPKMLAIGSSTGGPQALMGLVAKIGPVIDRFPVLITQHMPATFTTILAEHLGRASGRPAHEGVHGELVRPGCIYLAPGGRHMTAVAHPKGIAIALDDGPPVNFCKPAVDPLFISAAQVWQSGAFALVLTGMGADGAQGGKAIVAAGGNVIAQDEATSVVWGMPGAAAQAGICSAVLPLDQIAPKLVRLFSGDRS